MSQQEEIEQTLRDIQTDIDWHIAYAAKIKRLRQTMAIINSGIQLPGMCWDLYRLHYGGAFITFGLSVGLACWTWWCFSRNLRHCRENKRKLALLKMRGQQLLEQWRGYKN